MAVKNKVKLRYIEHYVLRDMGGANPSSVFAGVWIHGPNLKTDLSFRYLPGFPDEEERANEILNAYIEAGDELDIPDDALEQVSSGRYVDAFSLIEETEKYSSWRDLENHLLSVKR